MPEQALGGLPLGLGMAIEDKTSELSCVISSRYPFKCSVTCRIRFIKSAKSLFLFKFKSSFLSSSLLV